MKASNRFLQFTLNIIFFSTMLVSLLTFGFSLISCGPSAAEVAVRSAPSVNAVNGLKDKLIWLQGNAQSGGNYVLEIDADEKNMNCGMFSQCGELSYKNKSNITITLKGIGANRSIHSIFNVKSGVTLILDDNITIKGKISALTLVTVSSGGTLVMNDGSTITGATNNHNMPGETNVHGAGMYVRDGGTFIMKGGTISGNTISPHILTAQDVQGAKLGYGLLGGSKKAEEKYAVNVISVRGGGVYVSDRGTFVKTGGTITGYSSDPENGNVIREPGNGDPVNGFGHAAFFAGKESRAIDTTIGPEITLNFSNGTLTEGINEKPSVPAEPEQTTIQPDESAETQTPQDEQ
jgi:hypothetical protein